MVESVAMLRVIRRLRALLQEWWALELAFADRNGNLHGLDGPLSMQPVCKLVHAMPGGARRCVAEEKAFAASAASIRPGETAQSVCHAGMIRMLLPIHVAGVYAGAVLVAGYRRAFPTAHECEALHLALAELGVSREALDGAWERLRLLDDRDERYLTSLLKLVLEEITVYEQELKARSEAFHRSLETTKADAGGIVGQSKGIRSLLSLVSAVARSDASALITGESGTGKELVARCLHDVSERRQKPFVALNCGAFQDQLLESELFGHVRGAFTGAVRDKEGLLMQAASGTLFLDEVGEMSLAMQVKLLRVLQEGTFYPVGATSPRRVDVRIIAATHRDLERMIEQGAFRDDLFYRLNVFRLAVPPLRERAEDIPMLIEHFLERKCGGDSAKRKRLHPAALKRMCAYDWPGNVRELQNEIERMAALTGDATLIMPSALSEKVRARPAAAAQRGKSATLEQATEELERSLIAAGLERTQWNKSRLARELGISRTSLLQKIEKYGMERRRAPRKAA